MSERDLPRRPSLEHLRNEARDLQRSRPDLKLTAAQREVARSYGFRSWPALKAHVEAIDEWFGRPDEADDGSFLALACLLYGGDGRHRPARAAELLAEHGTADVWSMAAAGEAEVLRAAIAADPDAVHRRGGPFRWEPLLYACYARIPGRSTLDAATVLLEAGADPNAGYLWDGAYAFTALTGAFGGGEDAPNQPEHPNALELARRLLQAGADPDDTQSVYNRMFLPDDAPYDLLFEFGMGTGARPGPWPARLGHRAWASITDALQLALHWAARHGYVDRVRLLLDHGLDPNGDPHHVNVHVSHLTIAEQTGNREIARLLLDAGAEPVALPPVERFVAACMALDRAEVDRLRTDELVEEAKVALVFAASLQKPEVVRLMLDVGFDPNAKELSTALHEAAYHGDQELVRLLLDRGADPTILDDRFEGTAAGWAHHGGHEALAQELAQELAG